MLTIIHCNPPSKGLGTLYILQRSVITTFYNTLSMSVSDESKLWVKFKPILKGIKTISRQN